VLLATLHDAYAPAAERHAQFCAGGTGRAGVVKDVAMRGGGVVGVEESERMARVLARWVLGEGWRSVGGGGGELVGGSALAVNGDLAETNRGNVTVGGDRPAVNGLTDLDGKKHADKLVGGSF
jgi:hypothetical protein